MRAAWTSGKTIPQGQFLTFIARRTPVAPVKTTCCVVGGGPAGMMLGFLLARAGVPVAVLEKQGDFLRNFRGDTIHPSTRQLLYELGLIDEFLQLPHSRVERNGCRCRSRTMC